MRAKLRRAATITFAFALNCHAVHSQEPPQQPEAPVAVETLAEVNEAVGEPPKPHVIEVGEGKLTIFLPGTWEKVEPKFNMIDYEFRVAPVPSEAERAETTATPLKPTAEAGRLTISQAGGTVEANMQRWIGQFRLGRDADGADAIKKETTKAAPLVIHRLDIAGTYFDMVRGPIGPKQERPDYRMLGAMIETPSEGTWYIKFYGPQALVETEAAAFGKVIAGLKWKDEVESADASADQ